MATTCISGFSFLQTMLFMQQLKQHQVAVGEMIASQQHDVNRAPDKARSCLSTYLSELCPFTWFVPV